MGNELKASIDVNTGYAWTKPQGISPFANTQALHSGQLKLDLNLGTGIVGGGIHAAALIRGEERFMAGGQMQIRGRLFGRIAGFIGVGGGVSVNVQENNDNHSPVSFYLMPSLGLQIKGKKVGIGIAASVPIFIGEGNTPVTTGFMISLMTSFYWHKGANNAGKKTVATKQ